MLVAWLLLAIPAWGAENASDPVIPHLETRGSITQLIVDSKPFLILGGELENNSATSLEYMKPVWPRLRKMHLNTVLAAVSWAMVEPTEGDVRVRAGGRPHPRGACSETTARSPLVRELEEYVVELCSGLGEAGLREVSESAAEEWIRNGKIVSVQPSESRSRLDGVRCLDAAHP